VPVLAQVYIESAGRRLSGARPALLVASLLVVSLASSQLGSRSAAATPPYAVHSFPSIAFAPIAEPLAIADTTDPATSAARAFPSLDPELRRSPVESPAVVRFRPGPGQTSIPRFAPVSVRFTQAMDHAATERAFRATAGGSPVTGAFVWAEGDTVLVLIPSHPFRYAVRVRLAVSRAARSAAGTPLSRSASATFRVVAKAPPRSNGAAPSRPVATASAWRWPLIGPITQYFGQHLTKYGFHQGIDINGETGDPVVAARSGRVVVAGYADSCGGLQVRIDHGHGLESWYRHLSRVHVRVGARVSAGSLIGRVGATGCAFGSHLHFGIRRDGTFVDPLRYLPRR
jgi:murein DD-endopeptidase MepM/ murein hydrolase activator NlpD